MIRFITRNKVYDVSIDPLALSPGCLIQRPGLYQCVFC